MNSISYIAIAIGLIIVLTKPAYSWSTFYANDDKNNDTLDVNAHNKQYFLEAASTKLNATSASTEPGALLGRIDLICAIGGDVTCLSVCMNQGGSQGMCDFTGGCLCYV